MKGFTINAVLVLQDGSAWEGKGFGAEATISGEVVFNTGMVGYTESITDPSYYGQILCQTYPLIGNYGVSSKGFESPAPKIQGYCVSELCTEPSHVTSEKTVGAWLKENNVPGVSGIDTRALTKRLRVRGVMLGILQTSEGRINVGAMRDDAKYIEDPNARNLVAEVTVKEPVVYNADSDKTVVLIDCGAKENIVHALTRRGAKVVRVPANTSYKEIMSHNPGGVLVSNGPGDPKQCRDTINTAKELMDGELPMFGICLGNQIMALASGADTYKLKFGHRGQNQPCLEVGTKRAFITTQNHGFAVDTDSLSAEWRPWFTNANDGTNEGIIHRSRPWMSVQFHPEARPGPVDTEFLFDRFLEAVE